VRDHVSKAAKAGVSSAVEKLEAEIVPWGLEHIFAYYWELRASTPDAWGRSPITFQEIEAWTRLFNYDLKPWEIRAVRAIDVAHWQYVAERRKDKDSGRGE
jgi:hypothetical protein